MLKRSVPNQSTCRFSHKAHVLCEPVINFNGAFGMNDSTRIQRYHGFPFLNSGQADFEEWFYCTHIIAFDSPSDMLINIRIPITMTVAN